MEMYLGDWQFVTLLLYLDAIWIFIANVNEMLDQIEMYSKDWRISTEKLNTKGTISFSTV